MNITQFIGGGYQEMIGRRMSVDDAENLYYETHDCLSDDADAEQGRIERWCEDMNIEVTD